MGRTYGGGLAEEKSWRALKASGRETEVAPRALRAGDMVADIHIYKYTQRAQYGYVLVCLHA